MKVKDIMTQKPACCTPDTNLQQVARMMVDCNCGEIPVVESQQTMKPIGVVTDRDIACRAVAQGKNPLQMTAKECMTKPAITVTPETSVEECCRLMKQHQIRRIPVVDQKGVLCGMVTQADLARHAPEEETASLLKEVSGPVRTPSMAAAR
jgi:CBS domain-containing protein